MNVGLHGVDQITSSRKNSRLSNETTIGIAFVTRYTPCNCALAPPQQPPPQRLILPEPAHIRRRTHRCASGFVRQLASHKNIVSILGVCNTTVATEAYVMDLEAAVAGRTRDWPMRKVLRTSLDAARGMQAMHEAGDAPIVHFDIRASQLLVDDRARVVLNDFNMAYFMSTRSDGTPCPFTMKPWRKPIPWRPPEYRSQQVRPQFMERPVVDTYVAVAQDRFDICPQRKAGVGSLFVFMKRQPHKKQGAAAHLSTLQEILPPSFLSLSCSKFGGATLSDVE